MAETQRDANDKSIAENPVLHPEAVGGREPLANCDPTENFDFDTDVYRRMMSEELARQWEDSSVMSVRSWSLGPSLSESGFYSNSGMLCRKCELADDLFLCPESRLFWKKIPSSECCKRVWKDFIETLKKEYPNEEAVKKKRVLKMLKSLLTSQFQELGAVTIDQFLKFIRFFGPFRAEENRCVAITQVEQLAEHSSQKSKNKKTNICSWFGGYMTRQESEQKLEDKTPGTFLIRMSVTEEIDGCFALDVVMKDGTTDHFKIMGHPEEAVTTHPYSQELEFRGRRFTSLPDLVNNFLRLETIVSDPEEPENGVRCSVICPGLPYNHILDGYK